jgi:IclR family pca regulon transcriptional regulator
MAADPDQVQSFARGLRVIRAFDAQAPVQTLADVARATGLPRATVRRLLHTLDQLGYVRQDGSVFRLTPRVLELGYAYLASLNIESIAQPYLEALSEQIGEATSVSVLDDTDVVYVARVPTKRIMTVSIGLGSRFPAHQTSMGRVMLAELADDEIVDRFARVKKANLTPYSVQNAAELLARIAKVRSQGWALVDQELEVGIRSVAAPLRDKSGVIAAMNISTHAGRTDLAEVKRRFLPALLESAQAISAALCQR